jgi:hypothetical protein
MPLGVRGDGNLTEFPGFSWVGASGRDEGFGVSGVAPSTRVGASDAEPGCPPGMSVGASELDRDDSVAAGRTGRPVGLAVGCSDSLSFSLSSGSVMPWFVWLDARGSASNSES